MIDDVFPGLAEKLEERVSIAVTNALADLDTVSLQRCQKRLLKGTQKTAHYQALFKVWEELAARRKADIKVMTTTIDELNSRVALLQSVVTNLTSAKDEQ